MNNRIADIFSQPKSSPVYVIAELSANHNQNLDLALDTVRAMADSGADAVKVQTFTADSMTLNSDQAWFKTREDSLWAGRRLYELYQEGALPYAWHEKIMQLAQDLGMEFFSSPFDLDAVNFLESLGVPAYKIASFEITDHPLIQAAASTGKPLIMSTGVANVTDIQAAVGAARGTGNNQLALLKCTSAYPTPMLDVNLQNMQWLKDQHQTLVGLSDHTMGSEVAIASVVLGARIIEKHFILDRNQGGLDSAFSMEPHEFATMVSAIRNVEQALGQYEYQVTDKMQSARRSARSLFATQDIAPGEILTAAKVRSLRPGLGLHPKHYQEVLGKTAKVAIERGTPLHWDLIQ